MENKNTWKDIDPYLDLEDIGDADSQNTPSDNSTDGEIPKKLNTDTDSCAPRYGLRTRKLKPRTSSHPLWDSTLNVSYVGLFSDLGLSPTPK